MTPRRSSRPWRWTLALLLAPMLGLPIPQQGAVAQEAKPEQKSDQPGREKEQKGEEAVNKDKLPLDLRALQANPLLLIKEPTPWRVYQRDANNRAEIPVVLDPSAEGVRVLDARLMSGLAPAGDSVGVGNSGGSPAQASYRDGKIVGVPSSLSAYTLNCTININGNPMPFYVGPFFVGDLWVLAGQSNMQGVGNLDDVTPPSNHVALLGMDGKWARAEEPLHWLVDSPDPVHSGDPATRERRSKDEHRDRKRGAGLGLPFAVAMSAATGVPVGLIAAAHGGTSMAQWDPARKDRGGHSLYGSMLRQVNLAGGKVRGMLWYQGEAEANPEASKTYPRTMLQFIAAVREDLRDPDLPFYLVQLGRFVHEGTPEGWNAVRDAQRRLPDRVPNTAVVAAIDLELDDAIHIGTPGLKRLGGRLARVAQREVFGMAGATNPTLERVNRRGDTTLVLKFKGVNRVPTANGQPPDVPSLYGPPPGVPNQAPSPSPGQPLGGLQPARHIAGFSIRKADGAELPMIYDAAVGPSKDTVILRLTGKVPEGAMLWYGHGLDPYCNLSDLLDMAVPAFGPIALDEVE